MGKNLKGKELGEGLSQRKDGRYMARYKGKCRYADKEREIRTVYRQLVQDVESHAYVNKSALTLAEYFEEWLAGRSDIKGSSKANYKEWFKWLSAVMGKKKLQQIEKADVRKLQAKLVKDGKRPATVNSAMGLLFQIMKQAKQDGIITVNPCEGIKAIKEKREKKAVNTIHRALTKEEQAAFMKAAKGEWLYNMIDFMLRTGLRSGEARGLRWRDIDGKNGLIHVRNNRTIDEFKQDCDDTPKTETSVRDIPMTADVREILNRQRKQCREMFGNVQGLNDPVFKSIDNSWLNKDCLNYIFQRILIRMAKNGHSIDPITPHALRDTFATRAIEAGMTPQTLKTILGHSSLAMTMDLYAHVLPDTKREEMEKIAAAF